MRELIVTNTSATQCDVAPLIVGDVATNAEQREQHGDPDHVGVAESHRQHRDAQGHPEHHQGPGPPPIEHAAGHREDDQGSDRHLANRPKREFVVGPLG
jgi:hypothetical protein